MTNFDISQQFMPKRKGYNHVHFLVIFCLYHKLNKNLILSQMERYSTEIIQRAYFALLCHVCVLLKQWPRSNSLLFLIIGASNLSTKDSDDSIYRTKLYLAFKVYLFVKWHVLYYLAFFLLFKVILKLYYITNQ